MNTEDPWKVAMGYHKREVLGETLEEGISKNSVVTKVSAKILWRDPTL